MASHSRKFAVLAIMLTILFVVGAHAQELLDNDAVMAMKRAGLSDSVILAKIRTSQSKFDVSTQALVALKKAGLSDDIIEAMVGASGPGGVTRSPAAGSPAPRTVNVALPQTRESIFYVRGDQYIELVPAVSSLETNFAFFQSKSEIVLKGRKAAYRIAERQPVFLSQWAPNEVPLVRLKPGDDHDDRNLKYSSGSFMPFGGSVKQGVRSQDTIDVESEKDPRGFYRLKPKEPLAPGEYGFVLTGGFSGGAGGKIFDFGID